VYVGSWGRREADAAFSAVSALLSKGGVTVDDGLRTRLRAVAKRAAADSLRGGEVPPCSDPKVARAGPGGSGAGVGTSESEGGDTEIEDEVVVQNEDDDDDGEGDESDTLRPRKSAGRPGPEKTGTDEGGEETPGPRPTRIPKKKKGEGREGPAGETKDDDAAMSASDGELDEGDDGAENEKEVAETKDEAAGGSKPEEERADRADPDSDDGSGSSSSSAAGSLSGQARRDDEAERLRALRPALLGATVRVDSGRYSGSVGRIVGVGGGGYLDVEGLDCKVRSSMVSFLKDEETDFERIREYYRVGGRERMMPRIVGGDEEEEEEEQADGEGEGESAEAKSAEAKSDKSSGERPRSRVSEKELAGLLGSGGGGGDDDGEEEEEEELSPDPNVRRWQLTDFAGRKRRKLGVVSDDGAAPGAVSVQPTGAGGERPRDASAAGPVVLRSSDDGALVASCPDLDVRGLPRVDVFDRRTGRVLRGDDAVPAGELAGVLAGHAGYEPVLAPTGPSG